MIPDALGSRMKENYEFRATTALPRRTYTIIRVDGKAFHSYTRGLHRPYDDRITLAMDEAALEVCATASGVRLAYGQSDEYSFLLTDFERTSSEPWFDGKVQKIASITASVFTAAFYRARLRGGDDRPAYFDARVFTIPDPTEVRNYFVWRQQDASRNSVNMLASYLFSHKELHGVATKRRQDMCWETYNVNWNDVSTWNKRGRVIKKVPVRKIIEWRHKITGKVSTSEVDTTEWQVDYDIPIFTRMPEYLRSEIPTYEESE